MSQWFLSYDGQQQGPLDLPAAQAQARANPNGFGWRQGFSEWLPIAKIAELNHASAALVQSVMPPRTLTRTGAADEIDFKLYGEDMQFVEIELDPGESAVAEAGAMMYKDAVIKMETVFGDGSSSGQGGGFMDKLLGAGKRLVTGESLFTTVFSHAGGSGKARVAFAAPYPGTIIPVKLNDYGGRVICQKDSFLCAAKGVSLGIYFQKKILTGLFGGEGFIMQKLEGDGMAFMHAGGCVVERELSAGQQLHVDTGCVVGFTDGTGFDVQSVGGIKSMLFGGEGVFMAVLTGPGKVWMQSLPFSRMAGRILQAAPAKGGSRDEGSVLGGLGTLIGGDNRY